jgi:2-methylcitrate dehydratase PrpD
VTSTPTDRIAAFSLDAVANDLPSEVRRAVRRAMLDSFGVAVAGSRSEAAGKVAQIAARVSGPCGVIGTAIRTDPFGAALANGVAAHVLDWDDTILPTRAHLSAALLPALMAAGEERGWTLGQLVPAFAVGFEIQSRINLAVYPEVHLRGWQGTGIAGGAGTAAALGRLFGLSQGQIVHAMGIAATGAAGLTATFGSMSKALNIGRAGASGLQSACLAEMDFTSHSDIFGRGRFLEMYDDEPRHAILTDELGQDWAILNNGYKPYPCGFVAHAAIDAVRELRELAGGAEDMVRLDLQVSRESMHLMGHADPSNALEAKFSLLYDVAVAWVAGNVTPAAFEPAEVMRLDYRQVMERIRIESSDSVRQHEAFATVELDGRPSLSVHVPDARGTPARPMTDADLVDKFRICLASGGIEGADYLVAVILERDDVSVGEVMRLLMSPV